MTRSKIPFHGPNFQDARNISIAKEQKLQAAILHLQEAISQIAGAVASNGKIISDLVALQEAMVAKEYITYEEILEKRRELERESEERAKRSLEAVRREVVADADKKFDEEHPVQSESSLSDDSDSGDARPTLSGECSDSGNQEGAGTKEDTDD